ncbi:lipopolysaccharide heptosyltransferase II [Tundrisphaera sp. TA3]|uniref:lipopolysaccharide heptosyltransferase II n=1 Tax=Tundrisphaera sp. TA3 TaxID=3435775 RepID=UPI003EC06567
MRPPRSIAVFCPNLVGDTVMATPAFRAIRAGFPEARIAAVVRSHVAPTLGGGPWFDEIIPFAPKGKRPEERTWAVVGRLRKHRPDLAVLFPNSLRSAWMAVATGARRRVGYARGGRSLLLTDRLTPLRGADGKYIPTPIVDDYLGLARAVGCPGDGPRLELFTTPDDEAAADRAWGRLGLPRSRPVVCLNTGGAFGPAKSWPVEHFAAVARRLVDERGLSVLVVCGPSERDAARAIVANAERFAVTSLADEPLGIGLTKACVRRSALMITTDSGPRHFGVGFDIPVLSLFGPTHIAWTLTHHGKSLHLHHPVPCGPCQRPICVETHHRCLRDLAPDAVYRAATRMLDGIGLGVERTEAV